MKLSQLKYLLELKKYKTISKTAEKLFISQPTLSVAIRELEDELGFEIIKRTNKGVVFTARGEIVLNHCEKIMSEVQQIVALSQTPQNRLTSKITIGCVPYIVNSAILETAFALKSTIPNLSMTLREENSYDMVDMVYKRELDCGIIMVSNIEEERFNEDCKRLHLSFTKLFDDKMYIWCGPSNPLFSRDVVSLHDALKYSFVVYRNVLNAFNRNKLLSYNPNLDFVTVDDKDGVRKYLTTFQAVTVMPMCTIWEDHHYYKNKFIKPLEITDFPWTVKLGIVVADDDPLSLETKRFIDMLIERFSLPETIADHNDES